ncbi:co-chaperone DjlA [Pseudocolwellia sp. HL-MZ19]|uniref:co-chaperone DjlA n=1 Tax=Pseudocolwellia sp. HL-MZ19 TaxID=3400846 RepID=UPI003CEB4DC1
MRIWGKVLGGLFGFMLSKNIFGALLGIWLGHRFDKGLGLNFNNLSGGGFTEEDRQQAFFDTTFSVMGYVAKANGVVSSQEIAFATAYMDKLSLKGALRQQAQDAFREGKSTAFPLDERLKDFTNKCGRRHDLLLMFLEIQIQVAFADGTLDSEERAALHQIAKLLGFSVRDLDRLLEMIIAGDRFNGQGGQRPQSTKSQLSNAYKVLGCSADMTDQEIKKAYRKLMSQNHPDKLVAKGLPPEMMETAKEKAQDIQAAYETVTKARA